MAIGLLVYVVFACWRLVVVPVWQWSASSMEAMMDARFELQRAKQALSIANAIPESAVVEAEQTISAMLVQAGNEADAATQLQMAADALLKRHGLKLDGIQSTSAEQATALSRVSIEIRGRGSEERIVGFLEGVERAQPLLRVERLILRSSDLTVPGVPDVSPRIGFEVTLTAYWRRPRSDTGGNTQ